MIAKLKINHQNFSLLPLIAVRFLKYLVQRTAHHFRTTPSFIRDRVSLLSPVQFMWETKRKLLLAIPSLPVAKRTQSAIM